MDKYTVTFDVDGITYIAKEANKPFINTKARAVELATFLKSVDPSINYKVCVLKEVNIDIKPSLRYVEDEIIGKLPMKNTFKKAPKGYL